MAYIKGNKRIPLFAPYNSKEGLMEAYNSVMEKIPMKHRWELSIFLGRFERTLLEQD